MASITSDTTALKASVLVQAAVQRRSLLPSEIWLGMLAWIIEAAGRQPHGPYPSQIQQYGLRDKNEPARAR
jgi:hypothetical protein